MGKGSHEREKEWKPIWEPGPEKMIRKSHQRASSRALPRQGPEHAGMIGQESLNKESRQSSNK